jgi:hypothetical protein
MNRLIFVALISISLLAGCGAPSYEDMLDNPKVMQKGSDLCKKSGDITSEVCTAYQKAALDSSLNGLGKGW